MMLELCVSCKSGVGQIRDSLGGIREIRWGVDPPNRRCQREANRGFLVACDGKSDTHCGYVAGQQPNPIEAVGNVYFADVDWSEARVCLESHAKDSVHGSSKLHRFGGCPRCRIFVHVAERIVNYGLRAAIPMGGDSDGADPKLSHMADQPCRQHSPLPLIDHGDEFLSEESSVLLGREMGATFDGVILALL
jgi:hypothetical protein